MHYLVSGPFLYRNLIDKRAGLPPMWIWENIVLILVVTVQQNFFCCVYILCMSFYACPMITELIYFTVILLWYLPCSKFIVILRSLILTEHT